jgi:hypothetical protein
MHTIAVSNHLATLSCPVHLLAQNSAIINLPLHRLLLLPPAAAAAPHPAH